MGAVEEVDDRLFLALGRAASTLWSDLPQEFQQRLFELFEEAVMFQGEAFRQPLAIYLHDRHERTTDALKAEAVPEPDSLGG
jgi:dsDNA-binding SOS-regulon protein